MIFDRPLTRLIPVTLLTASVSFGGGYALGWGAEMWASRNMIQAHYMGLSTGGACMVMAATLAIGLLEMAEARYWQYKHKPEPRPAQVEPVADAHKFTVEVDRDVTQMFYLSVTAAQLSTLTQSLSTNRSLSGRSFYGEGKPFTQPQFINLRREMVKQGMAEPIGNSYALTEKGARALERGEVTPLYASDTLPESFRLHKRVRSINRGARGERLGAR